MILKLKANFQKLIVENINQLEEENVEMVQSLEEKIYKERKNNLECEKLKKKLNQVNTLFEKKMKSLTDLHNTTIVYAVSLYNKIIVVNPQSPSRLFTNPLPVKWWRGPTKPKGRGHAAAKIKEEWTLSRGWRGPIKEMVRQKKESEENQKDKKGVD
uniref:Uncharacterized protein n=1 Tax=Meloidogyne enterolobii TaxID=390850 RepID=A0A6V7WNG4_MELEN|nr:unnamed protein product [Meloidogyne enterolobii]